MEDTISFGLDRAEAMNGCMCTEPINLVEELTKPEYSTDDFRMYHFKITPCPKRFIHPWQYCPYAHSTENARRRDPRLYNYSPTPCPAYKQSLCLSGDSCCFSHGVFERWLHPAMYRTRMCEDGRKCRRPVCFFAHTKSQLRAPSWPIVTKEVEEAPRPDPAQAICVPRMSNAMARQLGVHQGKRNGQAPTKSGSSVASPKLPSPTALHQLPPRKRGTQTKRPSREDLGMGLPPADHLAASLEHYAGHHPPHGTLPHAKELAARGLSHETRAAALQQLIPGSSTAGLSDQEVGHLLQFAQELLALQGGHHPNGAYLHPPLGGMPKPGTRGKATDPIGFLSQLPGLEDWSSQGSQSTGSEAYPGAATGLLTPEKSGGANPAWLASSPLDVDASRATWATHTSGPVTQEVTPQGGVTPYPHDPLGAAAVNQELLDLQCPGLGSRRQSNPASLHHDSVSSKHAGALEEHALASVGFPAAAPPPTARGSC